MRKTDELNDPMSCLNRANDDEPLFVLRANDALAPQLVRLWSARYFETKLGSSITHELSPLQLTKFRAALALADAMERWRDRDAVAQINGDKQA